MASCFETLFTFCLVTEQILLIKFFMSLRYWRTILLGAFVGTFTVILALAMAFTNLCAHITAGMQSSFWRTHIKVFQQYFFGTKLCFSHSSSPPWWCSCLQCIRCTSVALHDVFGRNAFQCAPSPVSSHSNPQMVQGVILSMPLWC